MRLPLRKLIVLMGGLAALLAIAVGGGLVWLRWYVQSDSFRGKLTESLGTHLHAEVMLGQLAYSDSTLRSAALEAYGFHTAAFNELEIDAIRADISFANILGGVLEIERLEAERARVDFVGPRISGSKSSASTASTGGGGRGAAFPHVEVNSARIQRGVLAWADGELRDVTVEAQRERDDWLIRGTGGRLSHADWPALTVDNVRVRQRGNRLIVERAELHESSGGIVRLDGEVRLQDALELNAKLDRVPLEPLLTRDWKQRLTGKLSGTIRVATPLPPVTPPEISGAVTITDARLEALPVLNELATFTQLAQFRTLRLNRVQADFRQRPERLAVSNLVAESTGLLRLEGAFVVENGQILGDLQLGLAPAAIQWLPGVRTKVFATSRDGYAWAPVHIEGPVGSPREDLSARLVAAVTESTVNTVRRAAESLPAQGVDAAKKLLDGILGK